MKKVASIIKSFKTYGVGSYKVLLFLKKVGVNTRNSPLSIKFKAFKNVKLKLKKILSDDKLKNRIKKRIDFIERIRTYKGMRHKLNYPVRGQRTHTNAKGKKARRISVRSKTKKS